MLQLPVDGEPRGVGSRAKAIVHYRFNADHWEYREHTGVDVGVDCSFELTENEQWTGNQLFCQIKGRSNPSYNSTDDSVSVVLKVSTVNYALSQANPYVLLLVDVNDESVFYLPIQEYFIDNPTLYKKLGGNQYDISLRIPRSQKVGPDDSNLQRIARYRYVGGPGRALRRAQ